MTITYVSDNNLYVNITNCCPCSCDFCVRNNKDSIGDSDSLWLEREPTKEEILEDILKRDLSIYPELVFCGFGEPLTRFDDVIWICKRLRQKSSIDIRINTNGLADLITGRDCASELEGLVTTLSISLNASTAERYNELCKPVYGLKSLSAILKFTKDACLYVPNVYMTVVDTIGEKEIEKCRALCESTGAEYRIRKYIP